MGGLEKVISSVPVNWSGPKTECLKVKRDPPLPLPPLYGVHTSAESGISRRANDDVSGFKRFGRHCHYVSLPSLPSGFYPAEIDGYLRSK